MNSLINLLWIVLVPTLSLGSPLTSLTVQGDVVWIDGQVIAEPTGEKVKGSALEKIDLKKIRSVLGRHDRSGFGHNNFHYIWDKLGFIAGEMHEKGSPATDYGPAQGALYNIALQMNQPETSKFTNPHEPFRGELVIDGVRINSKTEVLDVVAVLEAKGFKFDWAQTVAIRHRERSISTLGWDNKERNPRFNIFIFDAL